MPGRLAAFVAPVLALLLAACGGAPPTPAPLAACQAPTGCLRAERVGGDCQCLEWEVVSVEPVPVKFLVVGVIYAPPGNQSTVVHGFSSGSGRLPASASDLGARWRSIVRASDGAETAASLGPSDVGAGLFAPLTQVTGASAALVQSTHVAVGSSPVIDLPSREQDQLLVWINPTAAVVTDYTGGRTVSWSWRSDCGYPGGCTMPLVYPISAALLSGSATTPNPYVQGVLDALDAEDRAAILAHDPWFHPGGLDPASLPSDPRFVHVASSSVSPGRSELPPTSWAPCTAPLDDAGFAILGEETYPYGHRSTLAVQYGALATSTACAAQQPGLLLSTSTAGCGMTVEVYVDRRFGTILTVPSSPTAECTR